jgi:putative transposase
MFPVPRLDPSVEDLQCPIQPCAHGPMRTLSSVSECQEVNDSIASMTSYHDLKGFRDQQMHLHQPPKKRACLLFPQQPSPSNKPTSMRVCLRTNKRKAETSNDKSRPCKRCIPNTLLSRTPDQVSTITAGDFAPFWTDVFRAWSAKLWCPTVTDLHDSVWNSWSGSSKSATCPSWSKPTLTQNLLHSRMTMEQKNSLMISLQFATSSLPATTASELAGIDEPDQASLLPRTHMVALRTDKDQRRLLKRWMGVARLTYNYCVECQRQHTCKLNKKTLRDRLVNNDSWLVRRIPSLRETPYEIRDKAMCEFLSSYYTSRKKHGVGNFKMQFRSKKASTQTIYLRRRCYDGGKCYLRFWNKASLQPLQVRPGERKKWDGKELSNDGFIVLRRPNRWFIQRVFTRPRGETQVGGRVAALDPGVRTFQTIYDPLRESLLEFGGDESHKTLFERCLRMDKLQSKASLKTTSHKTRYHLRNKILPRLRYQFKCAVEEVHRKTARVLCDNYDTILLPALPTSKLSLKVLRCLKTKSVRSMLGWSHYAFRRRLIMKAEETGAKVVTVGEAYSSKGCGMCGIVRPSFSSKTFQCVNSACGLRTDRDWNGARNICLMTLSA